MKAKRPANISSVVLRTRPGKVEEIVSSLRASGLCEVFFYDSTGKIVLTIEGNKMSDEIRKMKAIMKMRGVLAANLACNYYEGSMENDAWDHGRFFGRAEDLDLAG